MRYTDGDAGRRSMISMSDKGNKARYAYQIFKMFSDNFGGDIIKCAGTDTLFMFATKTPGQITLVVSARGHATRSAVAGDYEIAFDADAAKGRVTSVSSFATDTTTQLYQAAPRYTLKKNGMSLRVEPGTFTVIVIKR
jgi:predicted transcriptional regulator of viral defense system